MKGIRYTRKTFSQIGDKWRWRVFDQNQSQIASGICDKQKQARAMALERERALREIAKKWVV